MESFYLSLPCKLNKESDGHYSTILTQNVPLNGVWEVGLSEISFPISWNNFIKPQTVNILFFDETAPNAIGESIVDDAIIPRNLFKKSI